jgi:hypothetical protein
LKIGEKGTRHKDAEHQLHKDVQNAAKGIGNHVVGKRAILSAMTARRNHQGDGSLMETEGFGNEI